MDTIGAKLYKARTDAGLSQQEVCYRLRDLRLSDGTRRSRAPKGPAHII